MEAGSAEDRLAERRRQVAIESEAAKKVSVLLSVDPQDGNDPIQQEVGLQIVPRAGDMIEFWDVDGGSLQQRYRRDPESDKPVKVEGKDGLYRSGEPVWAEVENVIHCAYGPERIEVWLKFDTFELDVVRRVVERAQRNDQP